MNNSKIMEERIKRVRVLFRELGFKLFDSEQRNSLYTAGFENRQGLQGGIFIDRKSKFLEISFTFFFSLTVSEFLKRRLEEMLKLCYEYGCYINLDETEKDICFSVFTKVYYSGLNYYSLKQTMKDFNECVESLTQVLEINNEK